MSDVIQFSFHQIDGLATHISGQSQQLEGILASLDGQISQIANQSWRGTAAGQFDEAWVKWKGACQQMHVALTSMDTALKGLSQSFQQADQFTSSSL